MTATCIELFHSDKDEWVMVPPKDSEAQPSIGIGSASYEGAGDFKIHVSINPKEMEKALPILLRILYSEDASKVGMKFQTNTMVLGKHQIGKEFVLIFTKEAESREYQDHTIEIVLLQLEKAFREHGISPENGMVLTAKTYQQIDYSKQPQEKINLEQRKFDHEIAGSQYFYYRCKEYTAIDDSADWVSEVEPRNKEENRFVWYSELDKILAESPHWIHNPRKLPDPYMLMNLNPSST